MFTSTEADTLLHLLRNQYRNHSENNSKLEPFEDLATPQLGTLEVTATAEPETEQYHTQSKGGKTTLSPTMRNKTTMATTFKKKLW